MNYIESEEQYQAAMARIEDNRLRDYCPIKAKMLICFI